MNKNLIIEHEQVIGNNRWFGVWAKIYDLEKYIMLPIRKKAIEVLNAKTPQLVIDIACGTGSQSYEMAKQGHDVTGVDLSVEMLKQAEKKKKPDLNLKFQQCNATKLPFKDSAFDIATISLALHDMPYEIDLLVLSEAKRVVKPNGTILIIEYLEPKRSLPAKLFNPIFGLYESQYWRDFLKRGLKTTLENAGLRNTSETNVLGLFQIVSAINQK